MRYNQEAYYQKHGASVLWSYAPKSDASVIAFFILLLCNWFTWIAQKTRWQQVADRLTKAAVEDWTPSMGGTVESKQLREEALKLLTERQQALEKKEDEAAAAAAAAADSGTGTPKKGTKKNKEKVSGKDKKRLEQEQLEPVIRELVHEMKDFGAGFHQPTWRDLFIVRLAKFPLYFVAGTWWQTKYYIRRLQRLELNDGERWVLTERAVGNVTWDLATDDDRKDLVAKELWIMDNLVAYKEEEEVKTWSRTEQKNYQKMKKQQAKGGKEL
jgi:DnaJ homolog subfamily C member 25